MYLLRLQILFICLLAPPKVTADEIYADGVLRKVIEAYQIQPFEPERHRLGPRERLGQALFFDPIASGPRQISCAACHIRSKGSADSIRLAVGLGAKGVGDERLKALDALIIPRNALPLFNRGSTDFRAFFWDGRVQTGPVNLKESPLGLLLPEGFDNLLAAATVFPLAEPDEMLGRSETRGSKPLTYHAELVSSRVNPDNFQERTFDVFTNLMKRLLGTAEKPPEVEQTKYRKLFFEAYPNVPLTKFNITHVGNALAAYISAAFELEPAPWDRYIKGETSALTKNQKLGAIIFFGKGRCVVCHTGKQFSDFEFHGLAIPQLRVGKHGSHLDYGRASATSRSQDRFTFRTPPLRNVSQTGPWGHNGIFLTLHAAIDHHVNPVPLMFKAQKESPIDAQYAGRILGYRSPILAEISPLGPTDIEQLIDFLGTLDSKTVMADKVALPTKVPSNNNEFIRK